MPKSSIRTAIVSSFLILSFSLPALALKSETLQIKGSDTMVNLGQAWAEEYMRLHPESSIAVTGGGSGTGISAIIGGTCDIAESSRSMSDSEKAKAEKGGQQVKETTVAYDGIAIIVHSSNPVSQLTMDQLAGIFTGKIKNWSEVGGLDKEFLILSRDRNSGTHVFFLEHVLRKGSAKGPEEYSNTALMMPSSQAIVQEVQSSDGAIGYVGLGYVAPSHKVLNIGQAAEGPFIAPHMDTILGGTYSISRPLYFYTTKQDPVIEDFTQFVLSPAGQEIVQQLDFVPIRKS